MFESIIGECQLVIQMKADPDLLAERLIKRAKETGKMEPNGGSKDTIKKRLDDYFEQSRPALEIYTLMGKVRTMDCSGGVFDVYKAMTKQIFPQVHCLIGPKSSGKTALCQYLARRANLKCISFQDFASAHPEAAGNPETLIRSFIRELHREPSARVIVDGFPETLFQLQYFSDNSTLPDSLILLAGTEGSCLKINAAAGAPIPPAILCTKVKEFYAGAKELLTFARKHKILAEIASSEDEARGEIEKKARALFDPEVLLVAAQSDEDMEQNQTDMVEDLIGKRGYQFVGLNYMMKAEAELMSPFGVEIKRCWAAQESLPPEFIVNLLRKFIYSPSGSKKVVLRDFPRTVAELDLFERSCATVSREFLLAQALDWNLAETTIHTLMHTRGKLTVLKKFSYELMDTYKGTQLQYVLVAGAGTSGKTTAARRIERNGFTFLDMEVQGEELKKRLATEENPAESITLTLEQRVADLRARTIDRKNKAERFVIDNLVFEETDTIRKVLAALGPPTYYIELVCDPKELKKRYMKKAELQEMNEEETGKFDKRMEAYGATKKELEKLSTAPNVRYRPVKTDTTEETTGAELREIFEPKLVLVKADKSMNMDVVLTNLSVKLGFLYLNLPTLIKTEIEEQIAIGIELKRTKKPRQLSKKEGEDAEFCAVHYDLKTVLRLLKDAIARSGPLLQHIVISGYLAAHKLKSWEEKQEFRAMDELFAIEKEVGTIHSVLNLTKKEYEDIESDRVAVKPYVKPVSEIAKPPAEKKEEGEAEKQPEEKGEETKVAFQPENFAWTSTVGRPRTLGQFFTEWKKCGATNMPASEVCPECPTSEGAIEGILGSIIRGDLANKTAYVQLKFPA